MVQTQVRSLNRRQQILQKSVKNKTICLCTKPEKSKSKSPFNATGLSQNAKQSSNGAIATKLDNNDSQTRRKNGSTPEQKENGIKRDETEARNSAGDYRQNLKMRKLEEFKAKKKREEEERERFVKEMAEKRAIERAEVVKQARRLLLYRKPLCRGINRALLVSECFRELEEQVAIQKTIKELVDDEDQKYADSLKADTEKFFEEQRRKKEEKMEKMKKYGNDLRKQIEDNETAVREKEKEEFQNEQEYQASMNGYFQLQKEYETDELMKKKRKLQQFFKDAIEEKKQFEEKLKRDEEYEDRAIEIYRKAKSRVQKIHKEMALKEREENERKAEIILKYAEEHKGKAESRRAMEETLLKKAMEEQEIAEKEKQQAKKDRINAELESIRQFQADHAAAKEKQCQEEKDFKAWEMLQRFKKDAFNKQHAQDERQRELRKRMDYADTLRAELEEKEARIQHELMMEEKAADTKVIIDSENKKLLDYAEEVVAESKGVRPLYPILKAIKECKKEMGLPPEKKPERPPPPKRPKRNRGIKKSCNRYPPEEKLFYL